MYPYFTATRLFDNRRHPALEIEMSAFVHVCDMLEQREMTSYRLATKKREKCREFRQRALLQIVSIHLPTTEKQVEWALIFQSS